MTEDYKKLYTGAFGIYHFKDPDNGKQSLLLVERGTAFKNNAEPAYGAPGGYVDIKGLAEQPRAGAVRELQEEIQTPERTPLLPTVTADRLKVVDTGIDYTAGVKDTDVVGVVWSGFQCELTVSEARTLKDHLNKMERSPAYAEAVRDATDGETNNLRVIPAAHFVSQAADIPFRYPHEKIVALQVATGLTNSESKPKVVASVAAQPKVGRN